VFDEAIIRGFVVRSNRPTLQAECSRQCRPEFNHNEIRRLKLTLMLG
jgi:hypothetical protein